MPILPGRKPVFLSARSVHVSTHGFEWCAVLLVSECTHRVHCQCQASLAVFLHNKPVWDLSPSRVLKVLWCEGNASTSCALQIAHYFKSFTLPLITMWTRCDLSAIRWGTKDKSNGFQIITGWRFGAWFTQFGLCWTGFYFFFYFSRLGWDDWLFFKWAHRLDEAQSGLGSKLCRGISWFSNV